MTELQGEAFAAIFDPQKKDVAGKLARGAETLVDASPVIGDFKAFWEAETPEDYMWATVGVLPVGGDAVRNIARGVRNSADDVAGSAIRLGDDAAPQVSIRDHYNHHLDMVDDLKSQLVSQGYTVSRREVSFGSSCGIGRCRPDIIARAPDGSVKIIEVKTGAADLSIRQSEIFPQIRDGNSIPRGEVAQRFGLIPGVSLRDQGYPNGIPVEVVNFPGVK